MGLESATYVDDFVTSNPPTSDDVAQGDDHLRLIKTVLKTTFPNATKAFRFPDYVGKTADYTVLSTDQNKLIGADATSAAVSLTLPTLAAGDAGWCIAVVRLDATANALTIVGTINGDTNLIVASQWEVVIVWWTGAAWRAMASPTVLADGSFSIATLAVAALTISGLLTLSATDYWLPPRGTTAQRPGSPVDGASRFNTTLDLPEFADAGGNWRQPSIAQPIAAGFKNLGITNNASTPNTQVDLDADAVTVETTGGVAYRLTSINLTINCATNGANGLDTGGLANNTFYSIWVIYNPSTGTTAGLASTSATSPTMPSGYTAKARLGWMRTDGSAHFWGLMQKGKRAQLVVGLGGLSDLPTLVTGAIGTSESAWGSFSVNGYVPTTARSVKLVARSNNSATASVVIAPSSNFHPGVTTTPYAPYILYDVNGSASYYTDTIDLMHESVTIYAITSTNTVITLLGWEDNL